MRVKLSPTIIARAKPRKKPFELSDADIPGLLLRVQPSGVMSFIVQWGRGRRKTIGRVCKHTVEQMRVKVRKILLDAEEHGEPDHGVQTRRDAGRVLSRHYKPHAQTEPQGSRQQPEAIETEFAHLFVKPIEGGFRVRP